MADLLLELFSEEIPARMQAPAAEQLRESVQKGLTGLGFEAHAEAIETFVSPRHLAIRVNGLPAETADVKTELKGPRQNAPQAALDGFLKKTGLTLEQLELRGDTYFANIEQKGRRTAEVLPAMLTEVIAGFSWPKSMRWGLGETAWVRPLKNICCLLDGEVLPVSFAGKSANNQTFGHRFLAPNAIALSHPREYEGALKKADVLVEATARQALILEQLQAAAKSLGLVLHDDPGLLREVTGLVEFPAVLAGRIKAEFMHLPPEVLISEMREHQRYFALHDAQGNLADRFLLVSNMDAGRMADKGAAIVAGNERVLRARLADGKFFWEQDQKKKLADWAQGLSTMVFHAKIGTMAEKVERLAALARTLAPITSVDAALAERAARLAKADLTTGMVGEFPELQGIMGRYYAKAQGEDAAIAEAIAEHYKPLGPSDQVPTAPLSVTIALADKLDTLAAFFAIGEKPTGSKDPFALRRAALGVIRLLRQNQCTLTLKTIFNPLFAHYGFAKENPWLDELQEFLFERLKVMLRDEGVNPSTVEAVRGTADIDCQKLAQEALDLQQFLDSPDGQALLAGYKRGTNILSIEEKKDGRTYTDNANTSLFQTAGESDFHTAITTQSNAATFSQKLSELAAKREPVDAFFAAVMVNDADPAIRENRLVLLNGLRQRMNAVADFSKILQG